ncbi:uncharacterized protein ACNS7B_000034 [Menidia menidia]
MLLGFILLMTLYESTVVSVPTSTSHVPVTENTTMTEDELSPLQVVATPDHPVAAGQRVHLHCSALTEPAFVTWSWKHLQNQTWKEVGKGRELILTEPEQSGVYCCHAKVLLSQHRVSRNHTVFIVSIQTTVGEKLGMAAFLISLLIFTSIVIGFLWLGWQRFRDTVTTPSIADKDVVQHEVASKGHSPQADSDTDVYINYTSTSAYTNLDPSNMTGENVYSTLS